jgi:hypothetical protein
MMLDAQADPGRRAWLPCTYCGDTPLYLLDYEVNLLWVQWGTCLGRWWPTLVSAADGTPSTCSSYSTPPEPDAYLPYDAIAAPPSAVYALHFVSSCTASSATFSREGIHRESRIGPWATGPV